MANGGSHHPQKPSKPQQEPTQAPKPETKKSWDLTIMNRIDATAWSFRKNLRAVFCCMPEMRHGHDEQPPLPQYYWKPEFTQQLIVASKAMTKSISEESKQLWYHQLNHYVPDAVQPMLKFGMPDTVGMISGWLTTSASH